MYKTLYSQVYRDIRREGKILDSCTDIVPQKCIEMRDVYIYKGDVTRPKLIQTNNRLCLDLGRKHGIKPLNIHFLELKKNGLIEYSFKNGKPKLDPVIHSEKTPDPAPLAKPVIDNTVVDISLEKLAEIVS